MKFAIAGASGLIGRALTTHLIEGGHSVVPLVRAGSDAGQPPAGTEQIGWDPTAEILDPDDLLGVDVVVNLAGPGIGDRRWTQEYRDELRDARVQSTRLISETLAAIAIEGAERRPRVLINASAIGYYGDRGDEELDEGSPVGTGFLPELCADWEAATEPASSAGIPVAIIRTGIVLTRDGGALKKLLPLFRVGLGGKFGSGRQWMSWISMRDEVRAIEFLASQAASGVFNLTAPNPARNEDFSATLAKTLHRPHWLPVPAFGPRLALGRQLADALLFDSARVVPRGLLEAGFEFADANLDAALETILRR